MLWYERLFFPKSLLQKSPTYNAIPIISILEFISYRKFLYVINIVSFIVQLWSREELINFRINIDAANKQSSDRWIDHYNFSQ
jgi:hypothetical protein